MTTPDMRAVRRQLRSGDRGAFAAMYADNVDTVFTLAHRLTGDWASAEDVVSETFLVAWRSRAQLSDDDRPLRPWLLGIAARQALNSRRSVRRRLAFLSRPQPDVVDDFADEAASRLDDARTLARAAEAIAGLSRADAEVLGLCVWSGLSYVEAARELDVPVGTVRSRLSRARRRLREIVDAPSPEDRACEVHQ